MVFFMPPCQITLNSHIGSVHNQPYKEYMTIYKQQQPQEL